MHLNAENYHSIEANREYLSVSQYKRFIGTYGIPGCEAAAMANLQGEWHESITPALLVGSYVDSHFEGTMATFKAKHPAIFRKDGDMRALYYKANDIIATLEEDREFMKYMAGEKQVVFTGEIFGSKWKCKVDSYIPQVLITDLKIMKAIQDSFWVKDLGYLTFVEYWGYDFQAAIYQKLVEQKTGDLLPFFIAAASKEREPDHEIIWFKQEDLDEAMEVIRPNVPRILDLKAGRAEPDRCGLCDYCRATKKVTVPVYYRDLLTKV